MYDESDYLTANVLNYIKGRVEEVYEFYSDYLGQQSTPTLKTWVQNEMVFVDDIKDIEEAIDYIGSLFGYPNGWAKKRNWNLTGENNISCRDLNRWIKNIDILLNGNFVPLMPSETLLPRDGYIYPNTNEYPNANKYGNPLVPSNNVEEEDD